MDAFLQIAERRIAESMARGEFSDLPGQGRPLELDDDRLDRGRSGTILAQAWYYERVLARFSDQ